MKEKICAWEIHDSSANTYYNGGARPFKSASSLDKLQLSDFYNSPYTKKQLKTFEYIGKMTDFFKDLFEKADSILPDGKYENIIKHTFGPESVVFSLYTQKAQEIAAPLFQPTLYIDFEAMNMRICGWYAELICENEIIVYEGIAKPFSDSKYVRRLWNHVYNELLTYSIDDICEAKHIRSYERYFIDMFSKAKKIYTYGDTDALFIKKTFGNDLYNFFKIKNIDACVKIASRVLSLDKSCKLFGINIEGDAHNPKFDVQKMRACLNVVENL